ncbi:hypothetical protein SAY87_004613 [Trapa incisa]|uniref:ACB domain-containing protein n=1 Tax=Trapa incisa TaxID=236973 RepID=A0AAN7JP35_9MYRT|nr:hypothetical protein SAY87_004613 [Trapa incisa]
MAMARASSGPAYPERFYAASSYAGFGGSPKGVNSRFSNDVALLLYALHQQATVGPCKVPKPRGWSPVEQSKWTSWHGLGNMDSAEAMRLFVKILEEEEPSWYSKASDHIADPVVDVEANHTYKRESVIENGEHAAQEKLISSEIEIIDKTQDKDVISEGPSPIAVYDQWVAPPIQGACPRARYEHGAAVIRDKMFVYGGNHNGRYLNDLHALDLRSWTWSKVDAKFKEDAAESIGSFAPCSGHSLIAWNNKLLSVAGHTKRSSESMTVREFDPQTCTWSILKTYGKPPVSRGCHSVTLVGNTLVIFGGQDTKRSFLNDLHILDLETMTWDEFDAAGNPPSPRSGHSAAVHAERYLLIFGGGSHATFFNDLHVLDIQTMEWSKPTQQGDIPSSRAGHAGVTVGENWFIVGGGDNNNGVFETIVLNMSTLVWSVVATVQGRVPLATEGLSLVVSSYNGEDVLVSFGGYNGHYNSEVNVLKPSQRSILPSKMDESTLPGSTSAVHNIAHATRDAESKTETVLVERIRETAAGNTLDPVKTKFQERFEPLLTTLKAEKEGIEYLLNEEKALTLRLEQELSEAEARNVDLHKEVQSLRSQLAAEQSRSFKLEVDVAEMRQKQQMMEALQKELELLQRQKAASEQAILSASQRQSSGGVWSWLAGTPPPPGMKENNA